MIGRAYPPFLFTGKVILDVNRSSAGTRVNGRYVAGTVSVVQVEANVQPYQRRTGEASPPEGDRHRSLVKVFAKQALVPVSEGDPSQIADTFEWEGDLYEVMQVLPWKMGLMDHYECLAIKKEKT